jgi:hypothetical protein
LRHERTLARAWLLRYARAALCDVSAVVRRVRVRQPAFVPPVRDTRPAVWGIGVLVRDMVLFVRSAALGSDQARSRAHTAPRADLEQLNLQGLETLRAYLKNRLTWPASSGRAT